MSTSITEMKASKTESLTELPLESCPKSCFSSLFFLELESYIVSKMSKLTSNRKADLLRLGGGVTGQEGLKLVFWTKITPFYWRKFCLLLSAHSSAKDSQVHNLLRTRAWTRHWRWSVLTVESVAKGFQVGGS